MAYHTSASATSAAPGRPETRMCGNCNAVGHLRSECPHPLAHRTERTIRGGVRVANSKKFDERCEALGLDGGAVPCGPNGARPVRDTEPSTGPLTIPSFRLAGILIGPRGYKVRQLQHALRCTISIDTTRLPCAVRITAGNQRDADAAAECVAALIAEIEEVDAEAKKIAAKGAAEEAERAAAEAAARAAAEASAAPPPLSHLAAEHVSAEALALAQPGPGGSDFTAFLKQLHEDGVRVTNAAARAFYKLQRHAKLADNEASAPPPAPLLGPEPDEDARLLAAFATFAQQMGPSLAKDGNGKKRPPRQVKDSLWALWASQQARLPDAERPARSDDRAWLEASLVAP